MTGRTVRMLDRYGVEDDDANLDRFAGVLDALTDDGDDEHGSVAISDSDEWSLEFYRDRVLFENLETGRVGQIRGLDRADRLALADEFLAGDLDAVRARDWR